MTNAGQVTVSIVSHGHGAMLPGLLKELSACPEVSKVLLTHNIPETGVAFAMPGWLMTTVNARPRGFGENHNAAFRASDTPFFAVLNPDIHLKENPFPTLLRCMDDPKVALCAPAVVDSAGVLEDSVRYFPSLFDLFRKAIKIYDGRLDVALGGGAVAAPWVAGMFMLVRTTDYAALGGFDEEFYLYYEDVDVCARVWQSGRRVMFCPQSQVVHDARRASRRNLRHMRWHALSMARYFRKHSRYQWRPG